MSNLRVEFAYDTAEWTTTAKETYARAMQKPMWIEKAKGRKKSSSSSSADRPDERTACVPSIHEIGVQQHPPLASSARVSSLFLLSVRRFSECRWCKYIVRMDHTNRAHTHLYHPPHTNHCRLVFCLVVHIKVIQACGTVSYSANIASIKRLNYRKNYTVPRFAGS